MVYQKMLLWQIMDFTSLNENTMWWNGLKFLCESNLGKDLLNKIYVYENGDSLDEN